MFLFKMPRLLNVSSVRRRGPKGNQGSRMRSGGGGAVAEPSQHQSAPPSLSTSSDRHGLGGVRKRLDASFGPDPSPLAAAAVSTTSADHTRAVQRMETAGAETAGATPMPPPPPRSSRPSSRRRRKKRGNASTDTAVKITNSSTSRRAVGKDSFFEADGVWGVSVTNSIATNDDKNRIADIPANRKRKPTCNEADGPQDAKPSEEESNNCITREKKNFIDSTVSVCIDEADLDRSEGEREQEQDTNKKRGRDELLVMGSRIIDCEGAEKPPSSPPQKKGRTTVSAHKDILSRGGRKQLFSPNNHGGGSSDDDGDSFISPGSPETPVKNIQNMLEEINEKFRIEKEKVQGLQKQIEDWAQRYAKTKEKNKSKVKQYQRAYDKLSDDNSETIAKLNEEMAQMKAKFQRKEKLLEDQIKQLYTDLDERNAKLEHYRSHRESVEQLHSKNCDREKSLNRWEAEVLAREQNVQQLEIDLSSRKSLFEEKNQKYIEQLQRRRDDLDERERKMEGNLRRKIKSEAGSDIRFTSRLACAFGMGAPSGSASGNSRDTEAEAAEQRRQILDERERCLDQREKALNERERNIEVKGRAEPLTTSRSLDSPASRTRLQRRSTGSREIAPPSIYRSGGSKGAQKRNPQKLVSARMSPRTKSPKWNSGGKKMNANTGNYSNSKERIMVMESCSGSESESDSEEEDFLSPKK